MNIYNYIPIYYKWIHQAIQHCFGDQFVISDTCEYLEKQGFNLKLITLVRLVISKAFVLPYGKNGRCLKVR